MRNYKKGILPLQNDALKSHHTSAGLDCGTQSLESSLVVQVCGIFSSSWCLIGTAGPLKNVKQLLRCFIVFNMLCLCEWKQKGDLGAGDACLSAAGWLRLPLRSSARRGGETMAAHGQFTQPLPAAHSPC